MVRETKRNKGPLWRGGWRNLKDHLQDKHHEAVPYADLANPQTLNLYAYVGNNPVSHTDSDGHAPSTSVPGVGYWWKGETLVSVAASSLDATFASIGPQLMTETQEAQNLAWSSLSPAQQALVQGGEKAWNDLSAAQQTNFAAITHALDVTKLSDGTSGLSQVSKVTEIGATGIAVNWKTGAKDAFKGSGFSWRPGWGHAGENGLTRGGSITGLHLLFGHKNAGVGHVHIDYRGLWEGHYKPYNSDVRAVGPEIPRFSHRPINNYERYKSWYGPIPGYIP